MKLPSTVFLLDVDNTLLNFDAVEADLNQHLVSRVGRALANRYWAILELLRSEVGYADFLGAIQRLRLFYPHERRLLEIANFLLEYPFADRVYSGALETAGRLKEYGTAVILSDGDAVLQPHKIRRSGLWAAVDGEVLIYVHKERQLDDVAHRYPAHHYVMVDDKVRLLDAIKRKWAGRVTTVSVRQGHYATAADQLNGYMRPDIQLQRISELIEALSRRDLVPDLQSGR
jgi:FMN phosphatase YigB (HAD superfamily)